jgi:hypothetical protein
MAYSAPRDGTTYCEQTTERAGYGSGRKKDGSTNAVLGALIPAVEREEENIRGVECG